MKSVRSIDKVLMSYRSEFYWNKMKLIKSLEIVVKPMIARVVTN